MASAKIDEKTILDAAARVFAEKGWSGARVDEIAAEAGLNKAMLYYRVGDKEELYRRVVLQGQEYFTRAVESAIEEAAGPENAIVRIIEALAKNAEENRLVPSIMLREIAGGGATLPAEGLEGIRNLMQATRNLVKEGVEKGVFRNIDPAALHFMVVGAVFTLSLTGEIRRGADSVTPGPVTPGEIASSILNILRGGILRGGKK
jgi:AcrR family transcriptional regulator